MSEKADQLCPQFVNLKVYMTQNFWTHIQPPTTENSVGKSFSRALTRENNPCRTGPAGTGRRVVVAPAPQSPPTSPLHLVFSGQPAPESVQEMIRQFLPDVGSVRTHTSSRPWRTKKPFSIWPPATTRAKMPWRGCQDKRWFLDFSVGACRSNLHAEADHKQVCWLIMAHHFRWDVCRLLVHPAATRFSPPCFSCLLIFAVFWFVLSAILMPSFRFWTFRIVYIQHIWRFILYFYQMFFMWMDDVYDTINVYSVNMEILSYMLCFIEKENWFSIKYIWTSIRNFPIEYKTEKDCQQNDSCTTMNLNSIQNMKRI